MEELFYTSKQLTEAQIHLNQKQRDEATLIRSTMAQPVPGCMDADATLKLASIVQDVFDLEGKVHRLKALVLRLEASSFEELADQSFSRQQEADFQIYRLRSSSHFYNQRG